MFLCLYPDGLYITNSEVLKPHSTNMLGLICNNFISSTCFVALCAPVFSGYFSGLSFWPVSFLISWLNVFYQMYLEQWYLLVSYFHLFVAPFPIILPRLVATFNSDACVSWRHQIDIYAFLSQSASLYLWTEKLGLLIFRIITEKYALILIILVDFVVFHVFIIFICLITVLEYSPDPRVSSMWVPFSSSEEFLPVWSCRAGLVVINSFILLLSCNIFSTKFTIVLLDIVIWVSSFDLSELEIHLSMSFWLLKFPMTNQMLFWWVIFICDLCFSLAAPNTLLPVYWVVFKLSCMYLCLWVYKHIYKYMSRCFVEVSEQFTE